MHTKKKYFIEGDEVAHKENLTLKLIVKQIVKYKKEVTVYGKEKKEIKTFISGIRCGWWKNEKEWTENIFHSNKLVPWDIALQGKEKVIEWLEQN